jgi:hypothetical protein
MSDHTLLELAFIANCDEAVITKSVKRYNEVGKKQYGLQVTITNWPTIYYLWAANTNDVYKVNGITTCSYEFPKELGKFHYPVPEYPRSSKLSSFVGHVITEIVVADLKKLVYSYHTKSYFSEEYKSIGIKTNKSIGTLFFDSKDLDGFSIQDVQGVNLKIVKDLIKNRNE